MKNANGIRIEPGLDSDEQFFVIQSRPTCRVGLHAHL